jgi:hypothetical protein
MIDMTKLKGRRGQGSALAASQPPADRIELAEVPESAPAEAPKVVPKARVAAPAHAEVVPKRIDGRSLRRSSRVVQFATRVTPEFDQEIRRIAEREGLMIVEVLEQALEAYKKRG